MHLYIVYVGRDLTSEEKAALVLKYENDESFESKRETFQHQNSPHKIDGFNVAYEGIPGIYDMYVVCQHYVEQFECSADDDTYTYEGIDYSSFPKPHDERYNLRIRMLT